MMAKKGMLMKLLDWPPIWTAGFLGAIWGLHWAWPFGVFGVAGRLLGPAFLMAGLVFMLLAVRRMANARTTVIPRRDATSLVTSGVFAFSRNPIYLGDVLVVLAAIFWWDVPLGLPLVAVFIAILQARFISGEEARLQAKFGAAYTDWAAQVRRWL